MTTKLANDLAYKYITVNALALGFFPSDLGKLVTDANDQLHRRRTPLDRYGTKVDLAGVIIWLLSKAGSYVTGSVQTVDGGYVANSDGPRRPRDAPYSERVAEEEKA